MSAHAAQPDGPTYAQRLVGTHLPAIRFTPANVEAMTGLWRAWRRHRVQAELAGYREAVQDAPTLGARVTATGELRAVEARLRHQLTPQHRATPGWRRGLAEIGAAFAVYAATLNTRQARRHAPD